jgi:hypothetical protein
MGKWLVAGGLAIVGLLAFLLIQLNSEAAAPEVEAAPTSVAQAPAVAPTTTTLTREKMQADMAKLAEVQKQAGKLDPASDEFFKRYDDAVPHILTRSAAKCYTGGLRRVHRNQSVKLNFTNRIVNGDAFVENVRVVETSIDDPELIACFVREVQNTRWHDDELPDYTAPDELVISPERGMKKFTKENIDYVGEEAPVKAPTQEPGEDVHW